MIKLDILLGRVSSIFLKDCVFNFFIYDHKLACDK